MYTDLQGESYLPEDASGRKLFAWSEAFLGKYPAIILVL
jgi:hypothetical protein